MPVPGSGCEFFVGIKHGPGEVLFGDGGSFGEAGVLGEVDGVLDIFAFGGGPE